MRFICQNHQLMVAREPELAHHHYMQLRRSGLLAMGAANWMPAIRRLGAAYEIAQISLRYDHQIRDFGDRLDNLFFTLIQLVVSCAVLRQEELVAEYVAEMADLFQMYLGTEKQESALSESTRLAFARLKIVLNCNIKGDYEKLLAAMDFLLLRSSGAIAMH